MLSKTVESALNRQMNRELYSSYLYLSMSAYCESVSMRGSAHWLRLQAEEEKVHGMKFYDYLIEAGGRATMLPIEAPPSEWKSVGDVFDTVLSHEQKVTAMINDLVNLSIAEKDHATNIFLQWFVKEQVEEESNAGDIVSQIRLVGDVPGHLFYLDHHLGKR